MRWNAERAFGFIRSPASAADVFFHIRDFRGTTPPREGLTVVFEEIHGGGKGPRAMAVQAAGAQSAPAGNHGSQARGARRPETTRAGRSTARTETSAGTRRNTTPVAPAGAALAYGLMLAWAALVAWAVWTRHLPLWTVAALAGLNLATLWLYAADKNAARRGQWRIAEKQLHLLSVLGGWPAAWLARRLAGPAEHAPQIPQDRVSRDLLGNHRAALRRAGGVSALGGRVPTLALIAQRAKAPRFHY